MIVDSGIKFEGIEYDAVSKYLGEHMSKEEILEEKFEEIVYMKNKNVNRKKKKKGSGKTLNSNDGTLVRDDDEATQAHKSNDKLEAADEEELYLKPIRNPTEIEK